MKNWLKWLIPVALLFVIKGIVKHCGKCKRELLETDRDFCKLAQEIGWPAAFHRYFHKDGKYLPAKGLPKRKKDFPESLPAEHDFGTLMWEPEEAYCSEDGDMGYTFGRYSMEKDGQKQSGHYFTLWKKDGGEHWKVLFDTGNSD
jgi:hypothetical protein